jgi:hypothetical protein
LLILNRADRFQSGIELAAMPEQGEGALPFTAAPFKTQEGVGFRS